MNKLIFLSLLFAFSCGPIPQNGTRKKANTPTEDASTKQNLEQKSTPVLSNDCPIEWYGSIPICGEQTRLENCDPYQNDPECSAAVSFEYSTKEVKVYQLFQNQCSMEVSAFAQSNQQNCLE